ncbi:MAG: hypothetical protein IIA45_15640 [Bacteroidetes bacterium]|nr:hypothetical protein [Bacteroidota bacterium]
MSNQVGKATPKRSKPTFFYSIVSIALVLYMLGLLGVIVLDAKKLSDYFKENIEISVYLKDNVKEADLLKLTKVFDAEPYVKSNTFISKEDALEIMKERDEGFDFDLPGYNPLPASFSIFLNAVYANPDSLKIIEKEILTYDEVLNVFYDKKLVSLMNKNVKRIGAGILVLSLLLFVNAITLINNTIRLSMYSSRFLIKSMQLVGATWKFITYPFIMKGVMNGLISGILSTTALFGTIYYAQTRVPDLVLLYDIQNFLILFFVLLFIGMFISWWSTRSAVRKYLRMKLDDLY